MSLIITAVAAIGGLGLLLGLGIAFFSVKFKVVEDPRLGKITYALPGANCGGCGYPGCGMFAKAVLSGEAEPDGCPPGGAETAEAVAAVLGVEVSAVAPRVAFVRCAGGKSLSRTDYEYHGMESCLAASQLAGGGPKSCAFGCLGLKDCIRACPFNAIRIVDGVAFVNSKKCTNCGICKSACPKNLIEIVPTDAVVRVACNTPEPAKTVRGYCQVGCIGCKLCVKACGDGAIDVQSLLAHIDYDKCTNCTDCVGKCPVRCIVDGRTGIKIDPDDLEDDTKRGKRKNGTAPKDKPAKDTDAA